MRIVTLLENTSHNDALTAEHGLSLYIETENKRILFDAGQTDAFAHNAENLGIDLSLVDFAVLSHGHYDHGGGLSRFLELNDHAPIYMSAHAFGLHYNGTEKYIGLDQSIRCCDRIRFITEEISLCDGIILHCCENTPMTYPTNPFGLKKLENDHFVDEDFCHEIYMSIDISGKKVLFSGCSHRGILNIIHCFRPDICIGGFHFSKLKVTGKDAIFLEEAANTLLQSPAVFYTGHCTGSEQYYFMKTFMGNRLHALSCGSEITL